MSTNDPLDKGFELLRACSRERAPFDLDLEERMMKEFTNANRPKMKQLTKVVAAVVLCLLVTGAAVATGGIDWILNWTGTVELDDGSVFDVQNGEVTSGTVNRDGTMLEVENGKVLDEDGNVIGTVDVEVSGPIAKKP